MKKRIFLIFMLSFMLSGCEDYVELENLTIVTAVAIDQDEIEANSIKISLEVVQFSGDATEVCIVKSTGESFTQAVTNAVEVVGNDLYFSHVQAVIIGENVASSSIYPIIDYAYRNPDFRLNTTFLIAQNVQASDILTAKPLIDDVMGVQIKDIVKSNELMTQIPTMQIYEFIDDLSTKGICGMLPVITAVEEDGEEVVKITGMALFDNDKISGFLDENQTKILAILQNEVQKGTIKGAEGENLPIFNIISAKTEISPKIENGEIIFDFQIKLDIEIREENDANEQKNEEMQQKITNFIAKQVDELVIYQKNTEKTDFLGVGNMVYRKYPDEWEEIEYDEFLANLTYTLKVECEIIGTGLVSTPIQIEK